MLVFSEQNLNWQVWIYQQDPNLQIDVKKILDSVELSEWKSFSSLQRKSEFLNGRYYLKQHLSALLKCDLADLQITRGVQGRPQIKNISTLNHSHLDFNISHSQDFLGIVVSLKHSVGLDLQRIKLPKNHFKIAERYFSKPEQNFLKQFEEGSKEKAKIFTWMWSYREALVKVMGNGFLQDASDIALNPPHLDILKLPAVYGDIQQWSISNLQNFNCDYVICVASKA